MNKYLKNFIAVNLILGILSTSTIVSAKDNLSNDINDVETINIEVTNVDQLEKVVEFSDGEFDYEYDAENEILKINDEAMIQFETKVEYLSPDSGITEAEALENEKNRVFEELTEINDLNMRNTRNFSIPSNAPYTVYAKFSKSIREIYGEVGSALSHISALTTALSLTKIPYSTLLGAVSAATGLTSYAIEHTKGNVGGKWYYTQHRTTKKYRYYNSYQYGFRYAHSGIDIKVKIGRKTYTPYKSYSKVGYWWVGNKPY